MPLKAEGFAFEYEKEGTAMYAESFVIKKGKALYYLHFYSRAEFRDVNTELWSGILSGARWES